MTPARPRTLVGPSLLIAAVTAGLVWVGVGVLRGGHHLAASLGAGWAELVAPVLLVVIAGLVVCEHRWPAEPQAALARGRVHDAAYFGLHVALVVPLMTLLGVGLGHELGGLDRWVGPGWDAAWPRPLVLGLSLVLMDGANWLAHVADHQVRALWRLHALHHTQEELSVLTSFRAHPLSHLTGFALATLPVVVILGDQSMLPLLITAYICLSTLTHANVAWGFGPLGKVVVSPAYHRLHHALEGTGNVNFGIVFTCWDQLAGTARYPSTRACPTGLPGRVHLVEQARPDLGHGRLVLAQLVEPFVGPARTRTRRRLSGPTVLVATATVALCLAGWRGLAAGGGSPAAAIGSVRTAMIGPAIVAFVALVVVLERWRPAVRRPVWSRGALHDGLYLVLYAGAVVPLVALLGAGFRGLVTAHARWLVLPHLAAVPGWAVAVVAVVLMDGTNWLAHLANHRVEPLWRLHRVHHTQEELSVLTAFRAHPLVHLAFLVSTLPAVVLAANGGAPAVVITVYVCLSTLPHANVDWDFGLLGRVLVSPRYHRRHHAAEGRLDVNLGVVLTLWDVASGRARFPTAAERPAGPIPTGLAGRPLPVEQAGPRARHFRQLAVELVEPFTAEPAAARHRVAGAAGPGPEAAAGRLAARLGAEAAA